MMNKLTKPLKSTNDLIDSLSTQETLMNLLFSLSPFIQSFFLKHPNIMDVFFSVGVFLIFWRKKTTTVIEQLLTVINETLEDKEINKLVQSENFKIIFPQIIEALIKEVSQGKEKVFYRFTRYFIQNPNSNTEYLTKAIFVLLQMTPEEIDFLSIFDGKIQKEWVLRNKTINKTLTEAEKEVWHANKDQLNFVLKGKYNNNELEVIINSLYSYGVIMGAITYDGGMSMNGISNFGRFFVPAINSK